MAHVRLFANLRELAGTGRVEIDAPDVQSTLDALVERFGTEFGRSLQHARVWLNGEEAEPGDQVTEADEVALIPPVSGGAGTYGGATGTEPVIVAVAVVVLLAANMLGDSVAWMAAVLVGLIALWAIDVHLQAEARGAVFDPWPVLAATVVGALAATGLGAAGLGIAAGVAVVMALGWAVLRPEARELVAISSLVFASVIAASATASLTLTRLSTDGDDKVAAFVVMSVASIVVTWVVGAMRRPLVDPFTAGAVAAVGAAALMAALVPLDMVAWFLVGIVVAVSLIAGRGIGAAFRTGEVYLSERATGTFAMLDGPVLAAAIFFPFLRLVG